jgi:DNA topoisomerase-2
MSDEEMKRVKSKEAGGVDASFKLTSSISETNMMLFDSEGRIQKYKSPVHIMEEFAKVRMKSYKIRKEYLIQKLTLERDLLSNRARFIKMIIEKKLKINNRKKDEVVRDLTKLRFQKFGETKPPRSGYEYLLIMQIGSLTKERYEELKRMAREKAAELEKVKKTTHQTMWLNDLDALEAAINALYAKDAEEDPKAKGKKGKSFKISKLAKKGKGKKRGRSKDDEDGEAGPDVEGGDAEGGAAADDILDSGFGDMAKWTQMSLKLPSSEPSTKKRKTK